MLHSWNHEQAEMLVGVEIRLFEIIGKHVTVPLDLRVTRSVIEELANTVARLLTLFPGLTWTSSQPAY
jgi:hypothetical protein